MNAPRFLRVQGRHACVQYVQALEEMLEQEGSGLLQRSGRPGVRVEPDHALPVDSEAHPNASAEILSAHAESPYTSTGQALGSAQKPSTMHEHTYTTPAHKAADCAPATAFYTAPAAPDSQQAEEAASAEVCPHA